MYLRLHVPKSKKTKTYDNYEIYVNMQYITCIVRKNCADGVHYTELFINTIPSNPNPVVIKVEETPKEIINMIDMGGNFNNDDDVEYDNTTLEQLKGGGD